MPEIPGRPDQHTGIDEKVHESAEGTNKNTKPERMIGTQNSASSKIEELDKKIKSLEGYLNKPNLSDADCQNVENRKAELEAERDTLLGQQKQEPTENEASTPPADEDTQFRNEYSDPNSPSVESATDDPDFRDEYANSGSPPDEDAQFQNEYSDPNSLPVESATNDPDFRDEYLGNSNLSDTSSSEPKDSGGEISLS
jgi:hypothetical protein